jgi:hypothetical protein
MTLAADIRSSPCIVQTHEICQHFEVVMAPGALAYVHNGECRRFLLTHVKSHLL